MKKQTVYIILALSLVGCAAPVQYAWQDRREPVRDSAQLDLEECRDYAARQYRAGMPNGEPYLRDMDIEVRSEKGYTSGEWRPDRSPDRIININEQPVHDVPVDYTGYPGELDYSPRYLDDILEKCMHDRGWDYLPVTATPE